MWVNRTLANAKVLILADQAIVSATAVLTQLIVVKQLGLETYGSFAAIALVQLFILSIQQSGLTGIFQVINPRLSVVERGNYLSGSWTIEILIVLASAILLLPLKFATSFSLAPQAYVPALLTIVLGLLQDFFRRVFLCSGTPGKAIITDLMNNGLQITGLALLSVVFPASLKGVLWICAVSFIPALLLSYYWISPRFQLKNLVFTCRLNGMESIWMLSAGLLQWLAGNIYILAAGWWLGPGALGILRLGQYLFGIINVILQSIENYLLPKAAAMSGSASATISYLRSAGGKMIVSMGSLLLLGVLLAKPVLIFLDSANIGETLMMVYGMSAVYILVIIGYPIRIALRTLKLSHVFFAGYFINALFGLSTAYFLISIWNIKGVLAGLFLSQAILIIYWIIIINQKQKHSWI
jgi:hypothetical protein